MLKIPDRYKRNVYIFAALAFDETRFERKLYLQKLRCSEFQELIHGTIMKLGNLNRERIADHFKVKFVFEDDSGIIEIGQGHTIYIKLKKTAQIYNDPIRFYYVPRGLDYNGKFITKFYEMLSHKDNSFESLPGPCPLNFKNIRNLEKLFSVSINIFTKVLVEVQTEYIYEKIRMGSIKPGKTVMNLHFQEQTNSFILIIDEDLYFQNYHPCPNKRQGCLMTFSKKNAFERHKKACKTLDQICEQPKIIQKEICNSDRLLNKMKEYKLLTKNPRNNDFVFYDIECVLPSSTDRTNNTRVLSTHKLVSIAANSFINGHHKAAVWTVRDNSRNAETEIVGEFLNFVFEAQKKMKINWEVKRLFDSLKDLGNEVKFENFSPDEVYEMKSFLRPFLDLSVFGYNNARYDNQIIFEHLAICLDKLDYHPRELNILKKGPHYFSLNFRNIAFKDLINFSIPASLDRYLKTWSQDVEKLTYPYEKFASIDEIRAQKEFPEMKDFSTVLKGPVDQKLYQKCKSIYEYHHNLPSHHPQYWANFEKYLEYYNLSDVLPVSLALIKHFSEFENNFNISPMQFLGLPSFAKAAMLKLYDSNCPSMFTFPPSSDATKIFRDQTLGGLCNVYHRHITTINEKNTPFLARYNKEGKKWREIRFYDINAQYPSTFRERYPCGRGFEWTNEGSKMTKKLMTNQKISIGSIEWLDYVQQTDARLLNKFGEREKIISGWGSSEFQIGPFFVDGYCKVDGKVFVFEYNGCYFHDCDQCGSSGISGSDEFKTNYLKSLNVEIVTMSECRWQSMKYQLKYESKISQIILYPFVQENDMKRLFELNALYGFALVDIVGESKSKKFLKINWPPLFFKSEIEFNDLPEWMQKHTHPREFPRKTIVQGMKKEKLLLHTELIAFYLKNGFRITKIHKFFEFEGARCLQKVHDKVYKARVEATQEGNNMKATAVKLVSNSMYGQMLMVYNLFYFFLNLTFDLESKQIHSFVFNN